MASNVEPTNENEVVAKDLPITFKVIFFTIYI